MRSWKLIKSLYTGWWCNGSMLVSKTIGQSSNLCLPAKNIILERATCKEQGLPAKQIVHLVWIGVRIQPLRKRLYKYCIWWIKSELENGKAVCREMWIYGKRNKVSTDVVCRRTKEGRLFLHYQVIASEIISLFYAVSSIGRTLDYGSWNRGSTPLRRTMV